MNTWGTKYIMVAQKFTEWLILEEIKDVRNLYKDLLNFLESSPEDLYVHFSNIPRGDMKLSLKPAHSDPIGIYAFPKKYVLNEQASNHGWFGTPYVYVFKLNPTAKILNLSTLSVDEANDMLEKMGIKEYTSRPMWRRMDLSKGGALLWHTMHAYITENRYSKNITWNKLFKKAGDYDVVMDDGSGIIFSAEPFQICVMNPSVIEVVKSIENPINLYQQKVWNSLYKLATNLANKFFKSYKITGNKTGNADAFGSKYFKKSDLGKYTFFNYNVKSTDVEKPYKISVNYSSSDGKLTINVLDQFNNIDRVFENKPDSSYDYGMYILKNANFDNFEPEITTNVATKIDKFYEGKPEFFTEIEKLHKDITDKLNLPNLKTNLDVANSTVGSYSQISRDNHKYNCWVKVSRSEAPTTTSIYFVFKALQLHSTKVEASWRKSTNSFKLEYETSPENVQVDKVISELKNKMQENLQKMENDTDWSYIYSNDIILLRNLLDSFFKDTSPDRPD